MRTLYRNAVWFLIVEINIAQNDAVVKAKYYLVLQDINQNHVGCILPANYNHSIVIPISQEYYRSAYVTIKTNTTS